MNQLINIKRIILCSAMSFLLSFSLNCSLAFTVEQLIHLKHDHEVHESSSDTKDHETHSHKHKHSENEKEHEHKHVNTAFVSEVIVREKSAIKIVIFAKVIHHVFEYKNLKSDSFVLGIFKPPIFS